MKKQLTAFPENYSPIDAAKEYAGARWNEEMEVVITTALNISEDVVDGAKLASRYLKGLDNRPSQRIANPSKTIPDKVFEAILPVIFPDYDAKTIIEQHSAMMSLENLVGDLLEEYLSTRLSADGWYCCWGSSVPATDFCTNDGRLLQIKTSDNSENSSSSKIRVGTQIEKWFRRFSTKGTYNWEALKVFAPSVEVSEDDFRDFVKDVITKNPRCYSIS